MAPKPKQIDWDKLDLYLKAGCTQDNICKSFMIDHKTLNSRIKEKHGIDYSEYSHSLRSMGQMLIEATQLKKALEGNVTMLVWLGKIRCNQKEPDNIVLVPPQQNDIDKDHLIMQLQHKLAQIEEKNEIEK